MSNSAKGIAVACLATVGLGLVSTANSNPSHSINLLDGELKKGTEFLHVGDHPYDKARCRKERLRRNGANYTCDRAFEKGYFVGPHWTTFFFLTSLKDVRLRVEHWKVQSDAKHCRVTINGKTALVFKPSQGPNPTPQLAASIGHLVNLGPNTLEIKTCRANVGWDDFLIWRMAIEHN